MNVTRLSTINYRNLENEIIEPSSGINVIYGNNAQGKTNLLEALWLFTGGKSFRGTADNDLIKFNEQRSILDMKFYSLERDQNAKIKIEGSKRAAQLNGVDKGAASALIGSLCAVIFSPSHLSLIKSGPAERRKFIDSAICQVKPSYVKVLSRYNHIQQQRNTLLKDISYHSELLDTLEIWEDKLSEYAAMIIKERIDYINLISGYTYKYYEGISEGKEKISIRYISSSNSNKDMSLQEIKENLKKVLKDKRKNDILLGYTSVGPHRDDIEIELDLKSAKSFGSQGQQRSAVLSLKLAEAALLNKKIGESPIILLDDVMSELDPSRQNYVLNCIKDQQVFITCCEPSTVTRLVDGKNFEVKNGSVTCS